MSSNFFQSHPLTLPAIRTPQINRTLQLAGHTLTAPLMWLGHDLKSTLRVWDRVRGFPGILISAHQVLMRNRCFLRKSRGLGLHSYLGYPGPIFLDSGGFHFQQDGFMAVKVDELISAQMDLRPDLAAVLDLPLHPHASSRENARRWRQTLINTERMTRQQGQPPLALVVHSYNINHIERRCQELRNLAPDPLIVCIGSLVPILRGKGITGKLSIQGRGESKMYQRWRFIAQLIQRVRTNFPNSFLHVFGAGTASTILLLYLLGIDSVDSVAWRLKAAYGVVRFPGLADRYATDFIYTRTRRRVAADCWELLRSCSCSACDGLKLIRRVKVMAESFEARAIHNAQVFIDDLMLFRQALEKGKEIEFARQRLSDNPRYLRLLEKMIDGQLLQNCLFSRDELA